VSVAAFAVTLRVGFSPTGGVGGNDLRQVGELQWRRFEGPRQLVRQRIAGEIAQPRAEPNLYARPDRQCLIRNKTDHPRCQQREMAGQSRLDANVAQNGARSQTRECGNRCDGFGKDHPNLREIFSFAGR